MEKKITRNRVLEILRGWPEVEEISGLEVVSIIVGNIIQLEEEQKKIERLQKKTELPIEYIKEFNKIIEEEGKRDEKGNLEFKQEGDLHMVLIKNPDVYSERIDGLKKKYETALKNVEEQKIAFDKFMDEEINFDFDLIDKNTLPANIKARQYKILYEMIR